jgi:hypothetical protein
VIDGLGNRVSMPTNPFVVLTPIATSRLSWNTRRYTDGGTDLGGTTAITKDTQVDIQIDCYGPAASQWSEMLATLLFDEVACDALTVSQPLYVEGPRLMPWVDGEAQYQPRYMLTASLQYKPTTTISQQFAGVVDVDLIDVDVKFPPLGFELVTGINSPIITGAGAPLAPGS